MHKVEMVRQEMPREVLITMGCPAHILKWYGTTMYNITHQPDVLLHTLPYQQAISGHFATDCMYSTIDHRLCLFTGDEPGLGDVYGAKENVSKWKQLDEDEGAQFENAIRRCKITKDFRVSSEREYDLTCGSNTYGTMSDQRMRSGGRYCRGRGR